MADRLAPLLERFHLSASVFHSGALCGLASFDEADGVGHLHLFDAGEAFLAPRAGGEFEPLPRPALVLFPKPTTHRLFVPEDREATLLCASVRFGGGAGESVSGSLPARTGVRGTVPAARTEPLVPFPLRMASASPRRAPGRG
ncbi:MAG: cupin domain-containing protein, partial [Lysobacteraceae bacterium]